MVPFLVNLWQKIVTTLTCWYNFDGVNEYIINTTIYTDLSTDTTGSVSVWVKPTSLNPVTFRDIVSFGRTNGNEFLRIRQIVGSGIVEVICRDSGVNKFALRTDSNVLSSSSFSHIAVVQDGIEPKIYINGVLVPQTFTISTDKTIWFNDLTDIDNCTIGSRYFSSLVSNFWDGDIDEVTIYNKELSQQDVTDIYNLGRTEPDLTTIDSYVQNCVSHWRMGENDEFYDWLSFNGTNESISVANNASINFDYNEAFTLTTWFKNDTLNQHHPLFHKRDGGGAAPNQKGYEFWLRSNNELSFFLMGTSTNFIRVTSPSNSVTTTGQWNQLIATYDGSGNANGVSLYLNGVSLTTNILTNNIGTNSSINTIPLTLMYDTVRWSNGDMDKTIIYNKELSQAEVTTSYEYGRKTGLIEIGNEVSQWEMGEATTVLDQIGSNDGTTQNMDSSNLTTEWNIHDEMRREWTTFDGVNENISCGNDSSLSFERTEPFSISGWFYINGGSGTFRGIAGKDTVGNATLNRGYFILIDSVDKLSFQFRTTGTNRLRGVSTITPSLNTWYQFSLTYDGSNDISGCNLYINGILETLSITQNNLNGTILNNSDFVIGDVTSIGTKLPMDGNIDEVLLFDSELSQTDVTDIYNRGRNNPDYSDISGIVSHWKMDELNPVDQIGSNNGTSVNMTSTNLVNDINDGTSVNMTESNKECE